MIVKAEMVGKESGELCESGAEKMSSQMRGDDTFEGNACSLGLGFPLQQRKLVVVGYALTSKKTKSFMQPKLEGLARNKGIVFVPIDQNRPLSDQGPFDIVLHKLLGKEWRQILEDYRQVHPEVTVLDPPDAIQHLHNRQYMLQEVAYMNFSGPYGKVSVPSQLVIKRDASSIPDAVNIAGLRLPLVAKPLVADGSAKSHELSLAYDQYSLRKLEPPLVLQEFVNHGGVLFKVYIVGEAIKVVRRFSLPNVSRRDLSKSAGVFRLTCKGKQRGIIDKLPIDQISRVITVGKGTNFPHPLHFLWMGCRRGHSRDSRRKEPPVSVQIHMSVGSHTEFCLYYTILSFCLGVFMGILGV